MFGSQVLGDPFIHLRRRLRRGMRAFSRPRIRRASGLTLPIVVLAIRKGLRITPEGAQSSILNVRAIFSEVDVLLADGRRYLVEDRFTAADLTFAVLASPVLLPEWGIAA